MFTLHHDRFSVDNQTKLRLQAIVNALSCNAGNAFQKGIQSSKPEQQTSVYYICFNTEKYDTFVFKTAKYDTWSIFFDQVSYFFHKRFDQVSLLVVFSTKCRIRLTVVFDERVFDEKSCTDAWGSCWFDIDISIYTHQIFINLLSLHRGGIHLFGDVKKMQIFGISYEYFTVKICGILENLVNCVRYAWGVLLVRHEYLNTYTSDFCKLGISLKRRY